MASNAPTSFYFYVNVFFELIWSALRDRPIAIREAAAGALSAALQLTEERTRTDWYGQLWQVFSSFFFLSFGFFVCFFSFLFLFLTSFFVGGFAWISNKFC